MGSVKLAQSVLDGYDNRPPHVVCEPFACISLEEAYQIQHALVRLREARGDTRLGYKVGCTSETIQSQIGITQPISGDLFAEERAFDQTTRKLDEFAGLAVEGEIAVVLDCDPRDLDSTGIDRAITYAFPVIELHNFAIPAEFVCAQVLVANNAMHAGYVEPSPDKLVQQSSVSDPLQITIDDLSVATIEADALNATIQSSLMWLSDHLKQSPKSPLKPPVRVLCGSVAEIFRIQKPSRITVTLGSAFTIACTLT